MNKFKNLRKNVKQLVNESRTHFFENINDDLHNNPKRFWSIFKLKNKSSSVPETVYIGSGSTAEFSTSCPGDVAELFNKYFSTIITTDNNVNDSSTPSPITPNENFLSELIFSPDDILFGCFTEFGHE